MRLIIDNNVITTPIMEILEIIRDKTHGQYLDKIVNRGDYISITCPFHDDGRERNPSCSVYNVDTNDDIVLGTVHCFACGKKTTLSGLVAQCFGISRKEANQWLIDNFSSTVIEESGFIGELVMPQTEKKKVEVLDNSQLLEYNIYHPYIEKRKITEEVRKKFKIGYNQKTDSITFPVWDEKNNLVFISERSTKGKRFKLPSGIDKPVYGLNFVDSSADKIYVVESQINCLTLWGWGYQAIALFGTGSDKQYKILKKSGIHNFCLCFDGDLAGRHGRQRFIDNMPDFVNITYKELPDNTDVNDLTKEEFINLKEFNL